MTVGLVIVSHSAQLAKGVVELAGQMTQGKTPIAAAGGALDDLLQRAAGDLVHLLMELLHQALAVRIAGQLPLRRGQHLLQANDHHVLDNVRAGLRRAATGLLAMEPHHSVADFSLDLTFGA